MPCITAAICELWLGEKVQDDHLSKIENQGWKGYDGEAVAGCWRGVRWRPDVREGEEALYQISIKAIRSIFTIFYFRD